MLLLHLGPYLALFIKYEQSYWSFVYELSSCQVINCAILTPAHDARSCHSRILLGLLTQMFAFPNLFLLCDIMVGHIFSCVICYTNPIGYKICDGIVTPHLVRGSISYINSLYTYIFWSRKKRFSHNDMNYRIIYTFRRKKSI